MAKDIDVYRDWLKIKETTRPLNHYQLLRLTQFEDDPEKIRKNYRALNAEVRKYASGDYAKLSQELLNELAKAMLLLTDARRKKEYDATLGRKDKTSTRRQSFEELLLYRNVVNTEQLEKTRKYADAVGYDLRDALLNQKVAPAEKLVSLYAESQGLPYLDLNDVTIDESLLPLIPTRLARLNSCAPIMVDDGQLLVVSPHPVSHELEDTLRLKTGLPVRSVLCTSAAINAVVEKYYTKEKEEAEALAARGAKATAPGTPEAATESTEDRGNRRRNVVLVATLMSTAAGNFLLNPNFTNFPMLAVALLVGLAIGGVTFGAMKLFDL
ncbi:MAG TPA: hypothetical protein VGE52_05275 [Pirellulales bacterium]